MNKKVIYFLIIFFIGMKSTFSQSLKDSLLETINIKDLSFDNEKIKLDINIDYFRKIYRDSRYEKIKYVDDGDIGFEDRHYFHKSNYITEGEIKDKRTIYEVFITDPGTYLDNCKVTVGDDYSKLKSCYPNTYRVIMKEYEQMKQEDRIKYQKQYGAVIFQIPIIYEGSKDVPLGLIFSLNVATGKIEKIYTHYQ